MWTLAEVSLRPERDDDLGFLQDLVLATRENEPGYCELPADQRNQLLREQEELQRNHYRTHFPRAHFLIVEANGKPIGRFYLDHRPDTILVVELSLLPDYQGHGIGSQLIKTVLGEATRTRVTVTLSVVIGNPALQFYQHLGFQVQSKGETHHQMKWSPPA